MTGPVMVIDAGTCTTRAGAAGSEAPSVVFPTLLGRPRQRLAMPTLDARSLYVGEEALARRGVLALEYPVAHGAVRDWDGIRRVWDRCFCRLRALPSEWGVLLAEAPGGSARDRAETCRIMFEELCVRGVCFQDPGALALYDSGRTTGVVLSVGGGLTCATPVRDGNVLRHAAGTLRFGGRDLDAWLQAGLEDEVYGRALDLETVRELREARAWVSQDYADDVRRSAADPDFFGECVLPDGSTVGLGRRLIQGPELFFRPELDERADRSDSLGVHRLLFDAVRRSPEETRAELYGNVVLAGGCTLLRGFDARLEREFRGLAPAGAKVLISAPEDRLRAVFAGGSVVGSLPTLEATWLSRETYAEVGADALDRQ